MATVTGHKKGMDKKLNNLNKRRNLLMQEHVAECNGFLENCKENREELTIRMSWKKVEDINKQLDEINKEFLEAAANYFDEDELRMKFEETRHYKETFFRCEVMFEQRTSRKEATETRKEVYERPRLELKTFDGSPGGWLPFWHQFQRIHEDASVSKGDKLQYLHQYTSGKVRELVATYPQLDENYEKILEHVKDRFANNKLLVRYYVNEILKLVLDSNVKNNLETLYGSLETKLRALDTLGVTRDSYCDLLLPMVEAALPEDVLILWHRQGTQDNSNQGELESLLNFLGREVESRSKVEGSGFSFNNKRVTKGPVKTLEKGGTGAALMHVTNNQVSCIFCGKTNHKSLNCFSASKLNIDERKRVIIKTGSCFLCLRVGHRANQCKAGIRCSVCQGNHNNLLCGQGEKRREEDKEEKKEKNLACLASKVKDSNSYLPTLLVKVVSGRNSKTVRALIDSGCQRSYILESLAKELNLKAIKQEAMVNCLFGGVVTQKRRYNLYEVRVTDLQNECSLRMNVLGEDVICKNVPSVGMDVVLKFPEVIFSDAEQSAHISLVIGADVFGEIFTGVSTICKEGLTALQTRLGWVLTGPRYGDDCINMMTICLKNSVLPKLWDLDTLGIEEQSIDLKEDTEETMGYFRKTVCRRDGRYSVSLPWSYNKGILQDNYDIAEQRLKSMTSRLCKNNLIEPYQEVLDEWLNLGIVEIVPKEELERPSHYLAHRPVIRMSKETTKIRPVFDASCAKEGYPSLNDCLRKGPNLLTLIIPLLIRFRLYKYGLTADIEKAFLQIELKKQDRDFLRFLWWKRDNVNKELIVYRHRRLVFGVICSPFLLNATIAYHLENFSKEEEDAETKEIIRVLASSLYVDDCVVSVQSMDEVHKFVNVAERVMKDACFNLRGWKFNDSDNCGNETSVLGLLWNLKDDTLSCAFQFGSFLLNKAVTKRQLLSLANKIFDPIGFTAPVSLIPKLLLQEAWKLKLTWDESLPSEISDKFNLWAKHLTGLNKCSIPRWVMFQTVEWERCCLHMFCDASKSAYGAGVFLRIEGESGVRVQLLLAKSRVAPLKNMTIPRLELLGACIGSRLVIAVREALPIKLKVLYWTDSKVVLAWLRRNECWNVFVRNRVNEILKNSEINQWRHVPGHFNPADLLSRGCNAAKLYEESWWNGPKWLLKDPNEWPQEEESADEDEILKEKRNGVCMAAVQKECFLDLFTRYFSKYNKIIRMCAWVIRFIRRLGLLIELKKENCVNRKVDIQFKLKELTGELSNDETVLAEIRLLRMVQSECLRVSDMKIFGGLKLFRDEEGLVRLQSRLTQGLDEDYFQKPIVLIEHELVRKLIYSKHVSLGHAGVLTTLSQLRERFFIIRGRRLVRKIVKSCVICRKVLAKPYALPEAPLPIERISRVAAFQITGVDLGGPLFLRGGGKVWFAVFTCAVYRAVHLELVTQLSAESFIMALRRFIARRGRVVTIYSDRGTNFVGTNNLLNRLDWDKLQRESTLRRISWRFNPPSAPWWGGWWERMVGLVKTALKKTLGRAYLSYVELETVICDVEATLNSRPLTYLSEDPEDLSTITPAHFIQDFQGTETLDLDKVDKKFLGKRVKYINNVRLHLRERFRKEYLANLANRRQQKERETSEIKVGDVVLIEDHQRKRINWPLGKIIELIPGRDGKFRIARLRLESGELLRPIQRLYPLEVDSETAEVLSKDFKKTRSGRVVKPVKRLNL